MAFAVTPPRQLAPTVGPAAALAGVFIRTGSFFATGERVVSSLVHRFGSLGFINKNAPLPCAGRFINFGMHEVYVTIDSPCRYLEQVVVAKDSTTVCTVRGQHVDCPADRVEVMVTAHGVDAGKGVAESGAVPSKSGRTEKFPLEKPDNVVAQAGTSALPPKADSASGLHRTADRADGVKR